MVDSASKSKSKTIGKIRKRLGDIKPLPQKPLPQKPQLPQSQTRSVYTTKKNRRVLKKMPIKIQDIKNILNIPFTKKDYNNNIIKSILSYNYTDNYEENIRLLGEHIEKGKGREYKEYYKHLDVIRNHLDNYDIYEITNEEETEESKEYYNGLKSLLRDYDPLDMSADNLIKLKKFKDCIFSDKCITLYNNIIIHEFKKAITNDTDERVTKSTLKKKLNANIYTYRAIQFITNQINNLYLHFLNGNIIEKIELINILADKHHNIIIDNPTNDESNTQNILNMSRDVENSSSNISNTYIRGQRNKERELYLEYLRNNRGYNNEINEEDFITAEEWNELSLSKLRNVIKISYVADNKNFCHAFNSKALYKLWRMKERNGEIFKNPYSQKPFTEEDKDAILIALGKRDFRYDEDTSTHINNLKTRYDIQCNISKIYINKKNYWQIKLSYVYIKGFRKYNAIYDSLGLVKINVSTEMENVKVLLEKIHSLYKDNKILGKLIPFKIHPAFTKYNSQTIQDEDFDKYQDFYDMVFANY
jgi:hypothetical protein